MYVCGRTCARARMRACVHALVHACVRARMLVGLCVRVRVRTHPIYFNGDVYGDEKKVNCLFSFHRQSAWHRPLDLGTP